MLMKKLLREFFRVLDSCDVRFAILVSLNEEAAAMFLLRTHLQAIELCKRFRVFRFKKHDSFNLFALWCLVMALDVMLVPLTNPLGIERYPYANITSFSMIQNI